MTVSGVSPRSHELRQAIIDKLTSAGVILSGETMDGPWEPATNREAAMITDALLPEIEDHFRVEREDQDRRIEELTAENGSLRAANSDLGGKAATAGTFRRRALAAEAERDALAAERDDTKAMLYRVLEQGKTLAAQVRAVQEIAERAVAELGVVVDLFYERGHPGRACIRTGWVAIESYGVFVNRLSEFRAALAAASPGDEEEPLVERAREAYQQSKQRPDARSVPRADLATGAFLGEPEETK